MDPLQASSGKPVVAVGQRESPWEEEQDVDGGEKDRLELLVQSVSAC